MLNIIDAAHPDLVVVFRPTARAYIAEGGVCIVLVEVENLASAERIRAIAVLKGHEGEMLAIEEMAVATMLPAQVLPMKFELIPIGGEPALVELHLVHDLPKGSKS